MAEIVADVVAQVREPHEIRVRVEDDDSERCLGEQPLEDRSERVRLARARLTAEKRVPVERTRVEGERHAVRESDGADLEHRPRRFDRCQPSSHLVTGRRPDRGIAERLVAALEHAPFARDAARRVRRWRACSARRFERDARHVPETVLATGVLDDDVAADARVEAVHRDVEDKVHAVDRRRPASALIVPRHGGSLSTRAQPLAREVHDAS